MNHQDQKRITALHEAGVSIEHLPSGAFRFYGINDETLTVTELRMVTARDFALLTGQAAPTLGGFGSRSRAVW